MKNIINISIVFLLLLTITRCTGDFEEINTNPNKQTTGENAYLLTSAQTNAARAILDDYNTGYSKWVQYYTSNTSDVVAFWHKSGNDVNDHWNYYSFYVDILPNLNQVLANCEKNPHRNYWAMATIMQAWSYGYLVDMWGKVPYTYAFHGTAPDSEETDYLYPLFDEEELVYKAMIEKLFAANDSIDTNPDSKFPINGASDAFSNGDLMAWKKFCNTLNLRLLLRMSDVDAVYAKPLFEKIVSDNTKYPIITSNEDDFGIKWIGGDTDPWSNVIAKMYREEDRTYAVSTEVLHYLATMEDPRLPVFVDPAKDYTTAGNPKYIGCPPAFNKNNPSGFVRMSRDSISNIAVATFAKADRKEPIITYAELQFILAEAAQKGYTISGTAKEFYDAGIMASMEKYDVDGSVYMARADVDFEKASNKMETIILQRYLAQFGQGANSFAMMRRTGYPALDFFEIDEDDVNGFPFRVKYPGYVQQNPGFERSNAGEGIIDNLWGRKIWWAKNAPKVKMYNSEIQTGPIEFDVN